MGKISSFLIILLLICTSSFAQKVVTPEYVWDAYDLQMWLRGNFVTREDKVPADEWKSVPRMLGDRAGDCEDFAVLSSKVMTEILTWNQIVVIDYTDKTGPKRHAITIFKESDGTFSYFSNQYYINHHAKKVEDLLDKDYPTWQWAEVTNNTGKIKYVYYNYKIGELKTEEAKKFEVLNEKLKTLEEKIYQLENNAHN